MDNIWLINTPIGELEIHSDTNFLYLLQFINKKKKNKTIPSSRPSAIAKKTSKQINEYFHGIRKSFNIPLFLKVPPFYKKVLMEVSNIKYGQTASYKNIAKNVGNKKAVRAVGTANAKNPITIVIPCHRIISANGSLGGYGSGLDKKLFLLEHEGIDITL